LIAFTCRLLGASRLRGLISDHGDRSQIAQTIYFSLTFKHMLNGVRIQENVGALSPNSRIERVSGRIATETLGRRKKKFNV
jgi:hypothetical protein